MGLSPKVGKKHEPGNPVPAFFFGQNAEKYLKSGKLLQMLDFYNFFGKVPQVFWEIRKSTSET